MESNKLFFFFVAQMVKGGIEESSHREAEHFTWPTEGKNREDIGATVRNQNRKALLDRFFVTPCFFKIHL